MASLKPGEIVLGLGTDGGFDCFMAGLKVGALTDWNDPLYQRIMQALPAGARPSDFVVSLDVTARKG